MLIQLFRLLSLKSLGRVGGVGDPGRVNVPVKRPYVRKFNVADEV